VNDDVRADTSGLVGGPIKRNGAKGLVAPLLVPHFARAKVYAEPFFGAGSVFYRLPPGTYEREAVNDLDASLMTFFRVLRDRTDDLVRVLEFTPYARDEFEAALTRSDDPLEEARRVWVRSRQGFAGSAGTVGDWGRYPGNAHGWGPSETCSKLAVIRTYAARLRAVAIDHIDATDFVEKWGQAETFVYEDPTYLPETCTGAVHEHTMSSDDHRRLAEANHRAVERGARVAISGYPSRLYSEELYLGWRRVELNVALYSTREKGQRRTECLWMSYPATEALGYVPPDGPLFGGSR
jgi:DNA adenine methylase